MWLGFYCLCSNVIAVWTLIAQIRPCSCALESFSCPFLLAILSSRRIPDCSGLLRFCMKTYSLLFKLMLPKELLLKLHQPFKGHSCLNLAFVVWGCVCGCVWGEELPNWRCALFQYSVALHPFGRFHNYVSFISFHPSMLLHYPTCTVQICHQTSVGNPPLWWEMR